MAAMQSSELIKREIIRRINTRVWRPGQMIPGELELAREFGCARSTVNRAMQELARRGLLNRKRKAGTRVALNPVRRATLEVPVIREQIENAGAHYRHQLISRTRTAVPAGFRAAWHTGSRRKMLHMEAIHYADDTPFIYENRWINVAAVPAILEQTFNAISANEWLVQNAPFTHGALTLKACGADAISSQRLGIAGGAAIMLVERTTWTDDVLITRVLLHHRPEHCIESVL